MHYLRPEILEKLDRTTRAQVITAATDAEIEPALVATAAVLGRRLSRNELIELLDRIAEQRTN